MRRRYIISFPSQHNHHNHPYIGKSRRNWFVDLWHKLVCVRNSGEKSTSKAEVYYLSISLPIWAIKFIQFLGKIKYFVWFRVLTCNVTSSCTFPLNKDHFLLNSYKLRIITMLDIKLNIHKINNLMTDWLTDRLIDSLI